MFLRAADWSLQAIMVLVSIGKRVLHRKFWSIWLQVADNFVEVIVLDVGIRKVKRQIVGSGKGLPSDNWLHTRHFIMVIQDLKIEQWTFLMEIDGWLSGPFLKTGWYISLLGHPQTLQYSLVHLHGLRRAAMLNKKLLEQFLVVIFLFFVDVDAIEISSSVQPCFHIWVLLAELVLHRISLDVLEWILDRVALDHLTL